VSPVEKPCSSCESAACPVDAGAAFAARTASGFARGLLDKTPPNKRTIAATPALTTAIAVLRLLITPEVRATRRNGSRATT
jgi:hypothetical protein